MALRNTWIRVLFCAWLGLGLGTCASQTPSAESGPQVAAVEQALMGKLQRPNDLVDVIINFREPAQLAPLTRAARAAHYQQLQQQLMAAHLTGFTTRRQFKHVPAMAARISRAALERLRQDPNVQYIQLDGTGAGQLKEAVPAIGGDMVKSMYNLTGKGVRVAVLDTGVVTTHPDLMDSIFAQHCFTQYDCPPLRTTEGTSAEDDHGHGSNVAGIISSNGVVAPIGFAPAAQLVSVKIDDQNDSGRISDWVAGFDWVFDNLATLQVKVVNASICSTTLYADASECDAQQPALAAAIKNLVDAGVTVFAASGNTGSPTQLSAPACNSGVIAVAATYDSNVGVQPPGGGTYGARYGSSFGDCADDTTAFDQITCFSNTPKRVELVAPGAPMTSDSLGGKTETYWGTSQASPVAAAVAALMLECNPALTPAQIKDAMVSTGVSRMDPKNGNTFPSLRAVAAVRAACFGGMLGPSADGGTAPAADGGSVTDAGSAGAAAAGGGAGVTSGAAGMAGSAADPTGAGAGNGVAGSDGVAGTISTMLPDNGTAGAGSSVRGSAAADGGCSCSVPGTHTQHGDTHACLALLLGCVALARLRSRAARRSS